ncbi:MAG: SIS domain-containing protein [Thermodesulfobacteriota bacterium]|nr:SIS domain-containing protein [Thermodesulfobacteriota bacterium]
MGFFRKYFDLIGRGIESVEDSLFDDAAERIKEVSSSGKKIIIAGNGGSAAIASHIAVDFTKTAGIRAINFNEADLLTCLANDFGYERVFEKAIEFYGDEGDLLIVISSSGQSKNMLNAAKKAKEMGNGVITFSGFSGDNPLKQLGDLNFWVDSKGYNIIEMTHYIWLVAIIDHIVGNVQYQG